MARIYINVLLGCALVLIVGISEVPAQEKQIPAALDRTIDFLKEVQPIFERHCIECHGEDTQESGLRVDLKASLLRGGDLGEPAIQKGKGADSFLIQIVAGTHDDLKCLRKLMA